MDFPIINMPGVRFKKLRSLKRTEQYIFTLAKYGNHSNVNSFPTDLSVKEFLKINENKSWESILKDYRDCTKTPSYFKNYMEPTGFTTFGNSLSLSIGGSNLDDEGLIYPNSYYPIWKTSQNSFERAIKEYSYFDFLSSCALGVASIEAFINNVAIEWGKSNAIKLIDSAEHPVKFKDKISNWPTKITGNKFDIGKTFYENFLKIQKIRNDEVIHPKTISNCITNEKFCEKMNYFRVGINLFQIELHIFFRKRIPYQLIKASFNSDLECHKMQL